MNNPLKKERTGLVAPILIGAAVAGGVAWLLMSDDAAEMRKKLADIAGKGWDAVKENLPFDTDELADMAASMAEQNDQAT